MEKSQWAVKPYIVAASGQHPPTPPPSQLERGEQRAAERPAEPWRLKTAYYSSPGVHTWNGLVCSRSVRVRSVSTEVCGTDAVRSSTLPGVKVSC